MRITPDGRLAGDGCPGKALLPALSFGLCASRSACELHSPGQKGCTQKALSLTHEHTGRPCLRLPDTALYHASGAPAPRSANIRAKNASRHSRVWNVVACPETTCSTRPTRCSAATSVSAQNCTTKVRWGDSGGTGSDGNIMFSPLRDAAGYFSRPRGKSSPG